MKGFITVKGPDGNVFSGKVSIYTDREHEEILALKNKQASSFFYVTIVSRSGHGNELECFVDEEDNKDRIMVAFWFKKLPLGKNCTVTGKSFDTGRYVHWSCCFRKTIN